MAFAWERKKRIWSWPLPHPPSHLLQRACRLLCAGVPEPQFSIMERGDTHSGENRLAPSESCPTPLTEAWGGGSPSGRPVSRCCPEGSPSRAAEGSRRDEPIFHSVHSEATSASDPARVACRLAPASISCHHLPLTAASAHASPLNISSTVTGLSLVLPGSKPQLD